MADLYLSSGENVAGVTFGGNVFGSTGTETVTYTNDATGIVIDQNVEQVRLTGATSSYTFQQAGNQLLIFTGATQVARVTLQNDTNGTLISFANGTVEARVSAAGLTLGGTTVPANAPTPVVPTTIDSSGGTAVQTLTLTQGPDVLTGTNGNDTFNALPVSATGAAVSTLTAFDDLDGGAGTDTLNIYTTANENKALGANATIENIEIVNIFNADAAAAANLGDASKFVGVQQLWQIGAAADVTNLGQGTVAGFRNLNAGAATDVDVTATATATSVQIQADGLRGTDGTNVAELDVDGAALNSVSVQGTLAQNTANATAATLSLDVTAGKNVSTLTVNSAVATTLTATESKTSTVNITTVDASASAGSITFVADAATTNVLTGAGNDRVTLSTATAVDNKATTADETVSASASTGAGADVLTVATTGAGTTTVDVGDGNDTVNITSRSTGKLTVNLGAGTDAFNVAAGTAVNAGDVVDGGAGSDTLLLNIVGSANIGAFTNFEVFDAKGLTGTLDVDILASKNTVTEFVTTGDVVAGATLTNVGANVGYRILADTNNVPLTLTQKTAGAMTVTLDVDEAATVGAKFASPSVEGNATATNATALNAVFDSSFFDASTGAGDNTANLDLTGNAASTLTIVSGGANATNDLDYTAGSATVGGAATSVLSSATISGSQALDFDVASAGRANLATVNASALTGSLTFDLADLRASSTFTKFDGGTVVLGSGADTLTAATGETVVGFQRGTVEDAATRGAFDTIVLAGATQAADGAPAGAAYTLKDGKLTFTGAGPATLDEAVGLARAAADAPNETLVFEYLNSSYIFGEGATVADADDVLIQLSGTTGLAGLDTIGADTNVYVF